MFNSPPTLFSDNNLCVEARLSAVGAMANFLGVRPDLRELITPGSLGDPDEPPPAGTEELAEPSPAGS